MPKEKTSSKDESQPSVTPYKDRKKRINRKAKIKLEKEYERNAWPDVDTLELIASEIKIPLNAAYKWFGMRRAKAMGLPKNNPIYTVPEEAKDYISWRMHAADFGSAEYRAKEIEKAQTMAKNWAEYWPDHNYIASLPPLELDSDEPQTQPRKARRCPPSVGLVARRLVKGKPTSEIIIPTKKFILNDSLKLHEPAEPDNAAQSDRLASRYDAASSLKAVTSAEEPEIIQCNGYRRIGNVILVD